MNETRKFLIKATINNYEKEYKVKTNHLKEQKEIEIEWNGKFGKPAKADTNGDLPIQLKGRLEGKEKVYNVILTSFQAKKGVFKDRIECHGFKLPPNSDFRIENAIIESTEWRTEGKMLIGGGVILLSVLFGLVIWLVLKKKKVKKLTYEKSE